MVGGQGPAHAVGVAELTQDDGLVLSGRVHKHIAALLVVAGSAALFLALPVNPAVAGAEEVRRLAADIIVMAGDAHRLEDQGLQPLHRQGLKQRIAGSLATLPLAIRRARTFAPRLAPLMPRDLTQRLRMALADDDIATLTSELDGLKARYPFSAVGLLPPDKRENARHRARNLHQSYCAGCHDNPDLETPRPAWPLQEMARTMAPVEFAARLFVGVRGERLMALENPLTDMEISALIAFYRE